MYILFTLILWLIKVRNTADLYYKFCTKYSLNIRIFRQLENLSIKISKVKCDIIFLQTCLEKGLVPKFLQVKDKLMMFDDKTINDSQIKKMKQIIKSHEIKLRKQTRKRFDIVISLKDIFSNFDFLCLVKMITKLVTEYQTNIIKTHTKKLHFLWFSQRLHVPNNTVLNFSDVSINSDIINVLKTGLKHPVLPNNKIDIHIQVQLEKLINRLGPKVKYTHLQELRSSLFDFHKSIKYLNSLPKQKKYTKVIKHIKNNDNIKVLKFDKGQGVAILNTNDYLSKLHTIVDDASKFSLVNSNSDNLMTNHPVIKNQNKLNYLLKNNVKPFVSEKIFKEISPKSSQPGKLYGTAKVHKANVPIRPILASYNTAEYNLAKYLNQFITPIIPAQFSVNKNSELLDLLSQYEFTDRSNLVSFDVESLFTNVPLKETIQIAANLVYDSNNHPPFSKDTFIKLLQSATGGLFTFDNKLYKQIDGLAMGSPLAPTLSNLFMGVLENKYLRKYGLQKIKFYKRYVDDIIIIFEDDSVSSFFHYVNTWHPNIKFTYELGGKQLPFLDINIDITNNVLNTSVYRKPTYTNLLLNFKAICPNSWKRGLLLTLLHRGYVVCNSWFSLHLEIDKLVEIFTLNGYPLTFLYKHIKYFLNLKFSITYSDDNTQQISSNLIKIPFIGKETQIFKKRLKQIFRKIDKNFVISVINYTHKLGQKFCLKDKTPTLIQAGVVYKFTCEVDPQNSYIGKTIRHLGIRINEHRTKTSAILDHRLDCSCSCDPDNFEVIDSSFDDFTLRILEAIHIKRSNPNINRQLVNDGSFFSCKL